jgi:UTP--glucose-1-phosphate uridylyltransferase
MVQYCSLYCKLILCQGKEYVFVANSDNLGAIVDLSMLFNAFNSYLRSVSLSIEYFWLIAYMFFTLQKS